VYQGKLKKGDSLLEVQSEKKVNPKNLLRMHSNEVVEVSE